jgi:hypothetical protein
MCGREHDSLGQVVNETELGMATKGLRATARAVDFFGKPLEGWHDRMTF